MIENKNVCIGIIITVTFLVTMTDAESSITQITYVSSIDPDLGFYKVMDSTTHKPAPYRNRDLTINQGDAVIWKNDGDKPGNVTIVSDQKLFSDRLLRLIDDVTSYTFDVPGNYTFHLKERETIRQTITVSAVKGYPTPTVIYIAAPTVAPTKIPDITKTPHMTPNISISKPIMTSTKNITNMSNATNYTNTSCSNILGTISGMIDVRDIISDYIAGILLMITYIIYRKRNQKL